MTIQADKVSWFEIPADNLARVGDFYCKVFNWQVPKMGENAHFALSVKADDYGNPLEVGGINGGFHLRANEHDKSPVINIKVDDINSKLASIEAAGGKIIQPRTIVSEYGLAIALFSDTEGNLMGIYSIG